MSELFESTEALDEFKALMSDPAARQAFVELKAEKAESGTRRRYSHILKVVGETPWAIRRSMLAVIIDILAFRAEGGRLTAEEIEERIGARRQAPPQPSGVAVIPVHGVITPRASMFSEMSGATSIEGLRSMFRQAMGTKDVGAVVFDVDSPGGMTDQVPEMAAEIRSARGKKPMIAVAHTLMASAAYWLASQADEVVASKSALVGSIGVFTAHEDRSGEGEQKGIKTELISAGKHKTDGNPFEPLSDDGRATMQRLVDEFYGMFVGDVAKGRGVSVDAVRNGFGEGRLLGSKDAVSEGLVDRVGSLEDSIGTMLQATRPAALGDVVGGSASTTVGAGAQFILPPGSKVEAIGDYIHAETPDPEPEPIPMPEPVADPEPDPVIPDLAEQIALLRNRPAPRDPLSE